MFKMNKNFEIKNNEVLIKVNKNIYSKEVLVQASYVKLEDFYFLIDEKDGYYYVSMRYKEKEMNNEENLEKAAYEFFDELIESASYIEQLKRTSDLRQTILEKALLEQSFEREED